MARRDTFTNKLGFVFAAAGAAVGLGNIWKFPFEVAAGGGAVFLIVYLVLCFGICYPIMVAETAIGRSTRRNAIGAFTLIGGRGWGLLGKLNVLTAVLILSFYNVVSGWAFGYFLHIVRGNFDIDFNYMVNDIFSVTVYAAFFMFATVLVVGRGISKGIERASRLLMPTLLIMMLVLIIYALSLPHAMDGIAFYLSPDFSNLSIQVIYEAVGQAFFSLSLGLGNVLTYASYLPKHTNITQSTAMVTIADVLVAFLAGLMIFPMVSFIRGGDFSNIAGGPSLLFGTLPQVFAELGPVMGAVVGGFFFLLIAFAALTSTLSLLEIPVSYAVDELKIERKNAVPFMALFVFLIGVPSMLAQGDSAFLSACVRYLGGGEVKDFMSFVVDITDTSMILGGCLIAVFAAYVWRKDGMRKELQDGNPGFAGSILDYYINFSLRYLCPIILGVIFIVGTLKKYFGVDLF